MKNKFQNSKNEAPVSLRLAGVVKESIVDGPGLRFTIFCQGCPHNCPECHNPETHDFNGGYDCAIQKILDAIDANPLLSGVTFSGGEPSHQPAAFLRIAEEVKKRGLNIWMYSGYTLDELLSYAEVSLSDLGKFRPYDINNTAGSSAEDTENTALGADETGENNIGKNFSSKKQHKVALASLLSLVDVLIDGRFINPLKDLTLQYRGSSNQRVIDMNKTMKQKKIVLYEIT
ncbi:MAG: 4Fe-4S single cluster domain-containing protein [Hornefia sp.]|nr:4Fe-4S single cluster domain-containing protein [Hornefia sp.]